MAEFRWEASANGEILYFKNAILARAEINANMDELNEAELARIANTLPLMPIDVEHRPQQICGQFTAARCEEGQLFTDGLLYAARYPQEVRGVILGQYQLSIEAFAKRIVCGRCQQEFASNGSTCEHLSLPLSERRSQGIARQMRETRGAGGAITQHPAGTNTHFDPNAFYMVASLQDGQAETLLAQLHLVTGSVEPGTAQEDKMNELEELKAQIAQALAEKQAMMDAQAGLQGERDAAHEQVTALQASLQTTQDELQQIKEQLAALQAQTQEREVALQASQQRVCLLERTQALGRNLTAEEAPIIASMSPEQFGLFLAAAQPTQRERTILNVPAREATTRQIEMG
jgi:hypothetical protein